MTVPRQEPPGSDTAILSIFGCDPTRFFSGRSPLEAAGSGIQIRPGETSYRCNMVALEDGDQPFGEKRIFSHNAGSIDGEDSIAVVTWLFQDPEFRAAAGSVRPPCGAYAFVPPYCAAAGRGYQGHDCHASSDILGQKIGPYALHGNENADRLWKLMELANRRLEHHPYNEKRRAEGKLPANGIWFWAEGTAIELPNFVETYEKADLSSARYRWSMALEPWWA